MVVVVFLLGVDGAFGVGVQAIHLCFRIEFKLLLRLECLKGPCDLIGLLL